MSCFFNLSILLLVLTFFVWLIYPFVKALLNKSTRKEALNIIKKNLWFLSLKGFFK